MLDQQELPFEKEFSTDLKELPKPKSMSADNRLTTNEFLAIVNDDDPLNLEKEGSDGPPPLNQEKISKNWLTQT